MEQLYRKVGKRYVSAGYNMPDLSDGIWLVQSKPGIKSISSLVYKIGDVKKPINLVTRASLFTLSDGLASFISDLTKGGTPAAEAMKERLGDWVRGDVSISGIAPYDLADEILNFIASKVEECQLKEK